ncbi:hypothetical protein HBB16_19020 [Pseudonocardia sp. MCCB 268]|nr:hypothetical protein [Pseudonocardia cytotoxica]
MGDPLCASVQQVVEDVSGRLRHCRARCEGLRYVVTEVDAEICEYEADSRRPRPPASTCRHRAGWLADPEEVAARHRAGRSTS